MKFIVLNTGEENKIREMNTAYLVEDQWNDWFKYKTMYDLWIVDGNGKEHKIGKVKIGQEDMAENQIRPNLPNEFEQLEDNFFALGQSDYYYEKIKEMGRDTRVQILNNLNDIAFDKDIYEKYKNKNVTSGSLMRSIASRTVTGQFRRIANGGARLTNYSFKYHSYVNDGLNIAPMELFFYVKPESNPPTNIHVLIGRNGVGKTYLITNMINSIVNNDQNDSYGNFITDDDIEEIFSKVVFVSFSAFDKSINIEDPIIPYIKIGLPHNDSSSDVNRYKLLTSNFVKSLRACLSGIKKDLLIRVINILESDPIFKEAGIIEYCDEDNFNKDEVSDLFEKLSSGHKKIILTVTELVQKVEEKTLVFLDEPEGHLHPPLLSAFIRALSELLINRNGLAIIATHSPVVLQEVPKSCVWKMRRKGPIAKAERLQIESFGENITSLTTEVFGLEVTDSGFHNLLEKAVKKYGDYNDILNKFHGELGLEAKSILKTLLALNDEGEY